MERLQKVLAQAGVASRRKCEGLIVQGRVVVNGRVASLGESVDAETDRVEVDGVPVVLEKKVYVLLNKPPGVVTTVSERHGMRTVMDVVRVKERVFPVGRLDKDTTGVLLLTNDGEVAQCLAHPKFEVGKEYEAVLDRPLPEEAKRRLEEGVVVGGRKVDMRGVVVRGRMVRVRIHEGRTHIVKRLFAELGCRVVALKRTRLAFLVADVPVGKWRFLTSGEIRKLRGLCGSEAKPA